MQIEKVVFLDHYIIELYMSNNDVVQYDLSPLLNTARFQHINSQEFFKNGKLINNCTIHWDPVTEIQDYEILGDKFIEKNM